jgi:hypothetical protein
MSVLGTGKPKVVQLKPILHFWQVVIDVDTSEINSNEWFRVDLPGPYYDKIP